MEFSFFPTLNNGGWLQTSQKVPEIVGKLEMLFTKQVAVHVFI